MIIHNIIEYLYGYFPLYFTLGFACSLMYAGKSLNRVVALYLPLHYVRIFTRRNTLILIFGIYSTQLLLSLFISLQVYGYISLDDTTYCAAFNSILTLAALLFSKERYCFLVIYLSVQFYISCIISITLDIATIWKLRQIIKTNQMSKSKQQQEKTLLIMVMFLFNSSLPIKFESIGQSWSSKKDQSQKPKPNEEEC
jgi:hypothetical protein